LRLLYASNAIVSSQIDQIILLLLLIVVPLIVSSFELFDARRSRDLLLCRLPHGLGIVVHVHGFLPGLLSERLPHHFSAFLQS